MERRILFIFIVLICFNLYSQTPEESSGIFVISATSQYEMQNYDRALGYLERAEEILGHTNPDIESLRIKCYFFSEDIENTKLSLKRFFELDDIENSLWGEMSVYVVRVDDAERELEIQRQKEEEERQQLIASTKFYNGLGLVKNEQNLYGYINNQGDLLIPFEYDSATTFESDYALVEKHGETGVLKRTGEFFIPLQRFHKLNHIFDKNDFLIYVSDNNTSANKPYEIGFFDKNGAKYFHFQADKRYTDETEIYFLAGLAAFEQKDYLKASKFLEMVPSDSQHAMESQYILGNIYFFGDRDIAPNKIRAYEYYDYLHPVFIKQLTVEERDRIGKFYKEGTQDQKEKALLFYDSENNILKFEYIRTAIEIGSYNHAEIKLNPLDPKTIEDEKVSAEVYFLKGYLSEHKGDKKTAKKMYRKAKSSKENQKIANEAEIRFNNL